jgi:hypothetical protein
MDIRDDWTGIYGQKTPLTDEKYGTLKEELQKLFGIPVYKLGFTSDIDQLANQIIDFF